VAKYKHVVTALALGMLSPAHAAVTEAGRAWDLPAVNGTQVQCPAIAPRAADQLAAQFDTRPRDLDEMSTMAKRFMDPTSPIGADFRKKQDLQRASDWPYLCRYRAANAVLRQSGVRPDIVFMGDSITEGWIEADPAFFERNHAFDRGISGQSSSQMVARFYQDVIALRPRVVHILAGTNDIGGATGPVTEEEFLQNIRAMLDLARVNGIQAVLAAMPPMSRLLPRPDFDTRPVVVRLNARLRALATERHVAFVDYHRPLATADGAFDPRFANDGVHPTRAGYAIMAPLAQQALTGALRRAR
jgi:lysophospholipase L1-like esterase